jgi:acyl-coenzyme A synthetase/AMP-(fatty) acid ligase
MNHSRLSWLEERTHHKQDDLCIIEEKKNYSWKSFLQETNRLYQIVSEYIKPGDICAIVSSYRFETIALFMALFENQNIIVPITSSLDEEIALRLKEGMVDFKLHFREQELVIDKLEPIERHPLVTQLADQGRSGVILFSSGSTNKPKAMLHDLDQLMNHYQQKKMKTGRILVFLMFDHIGGLNTLLNAMASCYALVIPFDRSPETVCRLIESHQVDILPTSPTFLNLIVMSEAYQRYSLASLKLITYGTEAMPESVLKKITQILPKVKLLQTFGTSETGIAHTKSLAYDSLHMKITNDGNHEYKVVNGELWLKSKTQILGYLNVEDDSFTPDGWFKTGDMVEESSDGFLKIIGRTKEVINVGGLKVLPVEIESVLLEMESIDDCMVYG